MNQNTDNTSPIASVLAAWGRRKWLLGAVLLLSVVCAASVIYALPNLYRSSTTLLLGQETITESFVTSNNNAQLEQRLNFVRQELMSRDELMNVILRFDLYPRLKEVVSAEMLINRMRRDISIRQSSTSQLSVQRGQSAPMQVTISYQGWDPQQVADVSNALAAIYREKYETLRLSQANRTTLFLGQQLDEVAARLSGIEEQINDFRREHMGELPQQEAMNLATLERLNSDLRLNGERQVQLMSRHAEMASRASGFGTVASVAGESRSELLNRELAVMRTRYSDRHPGIIRLQDEIQQLESQTIDVVAEDIMPVISTPDEMRRLREQENTLRTAIGRLQSRIIQMPEIDQELSRMMHLYNTVREEHLALQRRYQDARLAESLELEQTQQYQVLEAAVPAEFAAAPNRVVLLMGASLLTVGGLVALVIIVSHFDRSFHSASELRAFTSVPVLAGIVQIKTRGDRIKQVLWSGVITVVFLVCLISLPAVLYREAQTAVGVVWLIAGDNS